METQENAFCNDNMDQCDKLLRLIEEGDADTILSEENMQNSFSELIKYELIIVKNDNIYLTELGTVARIVGVKKVVNELQEKIVIKTAAPVADSKNIRTSYLSYYIFLIIGLLMILLIQLVWK